MPYVASIKIHFRFNLEYYIAPYGLQLSSKNVLQVFHLYLLIVHAVKMF